MGEMTDFSMRVAKQHLVEMTGETDFSVRLRTGEGLVEMTPHPSRLAPCHLLIVVVCLPPASIEILIRCAEHHLKEKA